MRMRTGSNDSHRPHEGLGMSAASTRNNRPQAPVLGRVIACWADEMHTESGSDVTRCLTFRQDGLRCLAQQRPFRVSWPERHTMPPAPACCPSPETAGKHGCRRDGSPACSRLQYGPTAGPNVGNRARSSAFRGTIGTRLCPLPFSRPPGPHPRSPTHPPCSTRRPRPCKPASL